MKFIILSLSLFALASANVITGGKHRMDVHDSHLLEILTQAQPKINDQLNSPYFHRIGKVLSAESQVVSGIIYHVTFELGQTQCLKAKMTNLAECNAFANVQHCEARILSQPWLKNLEVTSLHCSARVQPAEEYFSGEKHKINVHDVDLLEALSAVQPQINDKLNSPYLHRIGKVIAAESQVVAGTMYHVTFELGQTQCLKSKATNLAECNAFTNVQICHAKIWSQPWLHHIEVTDIKCEARKEATFYDDHHAGGVHKIDVHDSHLLEALSAAQPLINDRLNSVYYHRIGKVLTAASQVVSGIMYHVSFELGQTQCLKSKITKESNLAECNAFANVQVCHAKIWSQPWLHRTEVTEIKCETRKEATFYDEHKAGGLHKISLHDEALLKALTEVQPQLNEKLSSEYFHRIGKVLEAESQIVAGIKYHVTFEIGQTQCLKSKVTKDTNLAECSAYAHIQVCHAKIWSQPWLHHTEITEVHCQARKPDMHIPHDIPGGKHPLDVNNKEMLAAVAAVQSQMSNSLNSPYEHTVTKVVEASSQVVSGILYHVVFEFGQTKCLKSHPAVEGCHQIAKTHHCQADILVQSWLNKIELHKFHCDN